MTGGRAPKAKGSRLERALVKLLQDAGLAAEKVPLSGAAGGSYLGDLTVPVLGRDLVIEAKSRANGFAQLYSWLEGRDVLVLKSDRHDAIVVVRLRLAAEIAMAAERSKNLIPGAFAPRISAPGECRAWIDQAQRNKRMDQSLTPNPALTSIDGFDERDDGPSSGGDFVKFDAATQHLWFLRDGSPLSKGPYIAVHCQKELVRWLDKRVVDRIIQTPGEPLPDVDELNAEIPREDWEEDFNGNPKGPWQLQFSVFLVDPADGSRLSVSNSTFGQKIAYERLKEKVQFMRAFRGGHVFPLIELSSKSMRTKFGLKLRPDFKILEWRSLGGSSGAPALAPAPVDQPPGGPVTKPTTSEIINDRLPWDDDLPANLS